MTPYLWVAKGLPPGSYTCTKRHSVWHTDETAGTYAIHASVIDGSAPPQYGDESPQLAIH